MTSFLRPLSLLVVLASLSIQANAATLYGSDSDGNLYLIDTDNQTVSTVGDMGEYGPEIQLTPDQSTVLLTDTSGNLWSIDSATGANLGATTINFPPPTPSDDWNTATALEYVGSTLYASFDEPGPETGPGLFGTLDPATGATTSIGILTNMNAPTGGLAYSGVTMYAVSSANSEFSELYTIDTGTGVATKIADITFQGNQVEAMTALAIVDGVAYTKSNDTTGGVDDEFLYSLDLTTGELTELFDMGEFIVALTSAPNLGPVPGSSESVPTLSTYGLVLTILGLLAVASRRLRVSFKRK